jgi:hypothetical protein
LIHTQSAAAWASYLGSFGDDRLSAVVLDPNPTAAEPVVVVGFSQNATDATDFVGVAARFSRDGTVATVGTVDLGSNTRVELHAAVVDPNDGAVYISGQFTQSGKTTDMIGRMNSALTHLDWSVSHTVTTSGSGSGVALDSIRENLYATGTVDGKAYVSELTNLTTRPTYVYDMGISSDSGPTIANGVAFDSAFGTADVVMQVQASPDAIPMVDQVNTAGTAINWSVTYPSKGPLGSLNAVTVDVSGILYVTGSVGSTNLPLGDELIATLDHSGKQLNGSDLPEFGGGQITGYAIQFDTSGNVFTGVTVSDATLLGSMAFIEFDPGLNAVLELNGQALGSGDDQNRGLALDANLSQLYLAGFTNSTDFGFTTGSFQPSYGGGPEDGVVVRYDVF